MASAIFFGLLYSGKGFMNAMTQIPPEIADTIIAIIIYFAATSVLMEKLWDKLLQNINPSMAIPVGLLAVALIGAIFSLLHAFASVSLNANQVISGTAINMIASALTIFLARYIAVMISGAFAGLAGAIILVTYSGEFSETVGGLGFLALAALIFGQWKPLGILGAALFFGFASTIANASQVLPTLSSIRSVIL